MLASVHLTITNNTPFSLNREREWLETGRDDGQEGRLSPGGGRQVLRWVAHDSAHGTSGYVLLVCPDVGEVTLAIAFSRPLVGAHKLAVGPAHRAKALWDEMSSHDYEPFEERFEVGLKSSDGSEGVLKLIAKCQATQGDTNRASVTLEVDPASHDVVREWLMHAWRENQGQPPRNLGAPAGGWPSEAFTTLYREVRRERNAGVHTMIGHAKGTDEGSRQVARAVGLDLARHKSPRDRQSACSGLAPLITNDAEVRAVVLRLAKDSNGGVRHRACETLGPLVAEHAEIRAAVLGLARDDEKDVRCKAGEALGPLVATDAEVRATALALAKDGDQAVRRVAVAALRPAVTMDAEVCAAVVELAKDADEAVRRAATEALGPALATQAEARRHMRDVVAGPDADLGWRALLAHLAVPEVRAVVADCGAAQGGDLRIATWQKVLLPKLAMPEVRALALGLAKHAHVDVRVEACQQLAPRMAEDAEIRALVLSLAHDPHEDVQRAVVGVLAPLVKTDEEARVAVAQIAESGHHRAQPDARDALRPMEQEAEVARAADPPAEAATPARPERTAEESKSNDADAKPRLTIGTLGHDGQGKTTLAAALAAVQSKKSMAMARAYEDLAKAGSLPCEPSPLRFAGTRVEYDTPARHYVHVDCAGHADHMKNLISGTEPLDVAILVLTGQDGASSRAREQVRLARRAGVPHLIVFINRCDEMDNEEMLDLHEAELRELLRLHGFESDNAVILRGAAKPALEGDEKWVESITKLLDALDRYAPREASAPAQSEHTRFEAEVYVVRKEEGGHHVPFFDKARHEVRFGTAAVTATVRLPENVELVVPGEESVMTLELSGPATFAEGTRFICHDGRRMVGVGVVGKILA